MLNQKKINTRRIEEFIDKNMHNFTFCSYYLMLDSSDRTDPDFSKLLAPASIRKIF